MKTGLLSIDFYKAVNYLQLLQFFPLNIKQNHRVYYSFGKNQPLMISLKFPAASPPAISAIKIGGRAAGGIFDGEFARCFGSSSSGTIILLLFTSCKKIRHKHINPTAKSFISNQTISVYYKISSAK